MILAYFVLLQSRGNPDFGQNPDDELSPELTVPVATLEEASRECSDYIGRWQLGGGNWSGGRVTDESGGEIAQVSYNGRVWSPEPFPQAKLLFDPR